MAKVDLPVLAEPRRLPTARRARRDLSGMPMSLDALARLAARVIGAPMAILDVMDVEEEHLVGSYGLPAPFVTGEPIPVVSSLCRYVVSADRPVSVADMAADPDLRNHALAVEFGARAFIGVPLHDAADRIVGSLLVVDVVARVFTDEQRSLLVEISGLLAGVPTDGSTTHAGPVIDLDSTSVLDGVQEAFVAVDTAGAVVGWNPAAERMLGWPAAQAQQVQTVAEPTLPGTERDRLRANLRELFPRSDQESGEPRRVQLRHRDGHQVAVQVTLSTLRGRRGPLACAFLIDLTGQQDAEHDADTQRGLLRALLDSLDTGVAAVDAQARPIMFNRAVRQIYGISDAEQNIPLVEVLAEHVCRPDGTPLTLEQTSIYRALRGEKVRNDEVLVKVPGKRVRALLGNAQPIVATAGQSLGAVVAWHEITERRRVERFRTCQIAVAAALTHASTAESAGPAVTRAVATALGWPHVELWLAEDAADTLRLVARHSTLDAGPDEFLTRPIVKGSGVTGTVWATNEPLWVPDIADTTLLDSVEGRWLMHVRTGIGLQTGLAVPIPDDDHALGVLTCFAGTAEYEQTQLITLLDGIAEQLGKFLTRRRNEQLALEIARAKDDFLSLIGHEVRTPLTAISSYVNLLLDDPEPGANPIDTHRLHEGIARNTDILRTTIDYLLDLAAMESGYLHITERPIDLAEITRQALHNAETAATTNSVTLTSDVPDTLIVTGDPQRLRQALDNLLSNAIKYTPDGGDVRLTLTNDDHTTTLTVTDTGIGIPHNERRHLFQRFYRATNARHSSIPGTGLGLTTVRAITTAHHGTVTLNDATPTGTTITIQLPNHKAT